MSNAIADILQDDVKLPSPPAIAVRILETVRREDSTFRDLARIISADPALSAKILRISNSSFYALSYKVDSIEKAVTVLGVDTLKNIALSFVIAQGMRGSSEGAFDFDYFWKRSITAAVGADLAAKLLGQRNEDIFVTALLMDLGIVVMYYWKTFEYMRVFDDKRARDASITDAELRIFNFDHQELGAELLQSWGLPPSIHEPVRYHHLHEEAPAAIRAQTEILVLGDALSSVYHGAHGSAKIGKIKEILGWKHRIPDSEIEDLVDAVAEKSVEILSSFEIDPGDFKPYSQILQEANEELGKLNLSYEQLVMELKEAKEKAEKLARELSEANDKLRDLAFRDGLTELFNHRYFQEVMEKEIGRAARYKRPFSLILFDIDHFKKVNDTYGHPAGDVVLREIGAKITQLVRSSDIVARYGGEEFAVILPETDSKGVGVIGQRLRRGIEQMQILADGVCIQVTVSLGATSFIPALGFREKAHMIEIADQALYESKRDGRNRFTFKELE